MDVRMIVYGCVYCERSIEEIAAEELVTTDNALVWAQVSGQRIHLCRGCASKHTNWREEFAAFLEMPVDFPPGVRKVEHTCPALEEMGYTEADCTRVLVLTPEGRYYTARCEHCGVTVRSLAE